MALEFIYFFFALFFFYAVMGMELFAQLGCPPSSFKNFGSSFFTLCEVFTGNNWIKILTDIQGIGRPGDACSPYLAWVAPLYFISFVTCAWFLLLTVIGIVLAISELALQDSLQEYRQWSSPSVEGTEAVSPTTATD
ncbi:voltage-dependent T-type calcium channel subunit alpha-1I-like [Cololabis saira]|uniref:voltage-dependent T-type calcium channel subunit alpha-1I-like n=1 Tax=Cololabis saira TaxID=129043 RepID=UPI002AD35B7F|nr:voltage-dependent T-type calcium channel subunit alpha-1I-like [Cololabis saira]